MANSGLLIALQRRCRHSSWLQTAVSATIQSPYIHAELAFASRTPNGYMIPSSVMYSAFVGQTFKPHRIHADHYTHKPSWTFCFIPLTSTEINDALAWLQHETGTPYDYSDAVLSVIFPSTTMMTVPSKLPVRPKHYSSMFCSEAVIALLQCLNIVPMHIDPKRCSPNNLHIILTHKLVT